MKTELIRMQKKLESYTPIDSFNKSRMSTEVILNEFEGKLGVFVSKQELMVDIGNIKSWFSTINEENSQKRNCY